jgi:1,2-diacylglycerol 3-alpha-glucosyltransferase
MEKSLEHIVFLTPGFPENESDTTTIPALQDYLKLIRQELPNTKLTLLAFQFPFSDEAYNWHGIDVIPMNGKNSKLKRISVWYNVWQTLKKLNHKEPITHIHSFWIGECSWIGQRFSASRNIMHFVTAMGQDVFKNKYARFMNPSKSKIITLSKSQNDLLLKNYGFQSEIIPWSVPVGIFPEMKGNKVDILAVGSLNSVKNYAVFIDIVEAVAKSHPNLKVEIIGDGGIQSIQKEIASRGLSTVITLCGKLSRQQVLQKMSESKILLHTSKYESFGYVFAEALYSGMKVVSFDVGASKSIPEWKIGTSNEGIIEACLFFLATENNKKRVLLNAQTETLNPYLKLYHG